MRRRPNVQGGGVQAPPAPSAPSVRNQRGVQAQPRTGATKQALRNGGGVRPGGGKPNRGPSGGVRPGKGPPGKFGGGKKTPLDRQRERERRRREREAQATPPPPLTHLPSHNKPEVSTDQPPAQPDPYADGTTPDPRDETYWANFHAINAQFDSEILALDAEGARATTAFNQEGLALAEYNRLRKRDMGESRLGSGSAYSGNALRDQLENDLEYTINEGRRFRSKQDADAARETDRGRLGFERNAALRQLEIDTAQQMADEMGDESIESAGDAGLPEEEGGDETTAGGEAAKGPTTKELARRRALRRKVKKQTKRIKRLREKRQEAENPKQKERITETIKKVRKNRTKTKGKLRS